MEMGAVREMFIGGFTFETLMGTDLNGVKSK
jgi:hypothetical protein